METQKFVLVYLSVIFRECFRTECGYKAFGSKYKKKTEEFSQNFTSGEDEEKIFMEFFSAIAEFFNLIEVYEIEIFELLKISNMNDKNV